MNKILNKNVLLFCMSVFFLFSPVSAMKKADDSSSEEKRKLSHSSPGAKGYKLKNTGGENIRKKKTLSPALWWLTETRKGRHIRLLHNRKKNSYTMAGCRPETHEEGEKGGYILKLPRNYKYDPKINLWYRKEQSIPQSTLKPKQCAPNSHIISFKPEENSKLKRMIQPAKK